MQVVHVCRRRRLPIGPSRLGVIAHVAVDGPGGVPVDRDEAAPGVAPAIVTDAELELPDDVAASDLTGLTGAPCLEHVLGLGDRIGVGREELDRTGVVL